jgi:hypothetical protein
VSTPYFPPLARGSMIGAIDHPKILPDDKR